MKVIFLFNENAMKLNMWGRFQHKKQSVIIVKQLQFIRL